MSSFIQGRFDVLPPPIAVLRFPVIKDAFVNENIRTLNYGDTSDLLVGPHYESFLGFDLSELPDEEFLYAKLVLNVPGIPSPSGEVALSVVGDGVRWTETGITYANRPIQREFFASEPTGSKRIEFDILNSIKEQYALTSADLHRFASRESGNGPYIEVAFLDIEALRETDARYLGLEYSAQNSADSEFLLSWEAMPTFGENKFLLEYGLSNQFLLTFTVERKFILEYVAQAREDSSFALDFAGTQRSVEDLTLTYTAVGQGSEDFDLQFIGAVFENWAVSYEAMPMSNFAISFGIQDEDASSFELGYLPTFRSEFGLEFRATADGERDFELSFGVQDEDEADFELNYVLSLRSEFGLEFQARQSDNQNFALSFGVQDEGESDFSLEFLSALTREFALHFDAQASSQNQFGLAFGAQASGESDFVVELEAVPNENFPLSFAAQMDGAGEFSISFTPRQTSGSEVSLEFEAMPAKSFGIEFAAQGHEVLDITLEWEALQRYFSDLRLEWEAGGSDEGGAEGAVPTVVLHESGCLKVLDAGVLIQGILITDTDDVLLEQVVLRRVEDSDGSGCDWKSHFGLK